MSLVQIAWVIVKPYRFYLYLLILNALFWGGYVSLSPYILKIIIDQLTQGHSVDDVRSLALLYVFLYFLMAMNFRIVDWVKYKIMPPIKKDTAMMMFNYLKYHSHDFFSNTFAGSIANKVNDMVVSLESLIYSSDEFLSDIAKILIAFFVMMTVHPFFAWGLLLWSFSFFVVSVFFSQKIYALSKITSESYSVYAGTLVDIFTNIHSVRLFSKFEDETLRLNSSVNDLVQKDRNMLSYIIKMRLVQDVGLVSLLGFMFWILLALYSQDKVTIGDFALILTITMSIFQSIWYMANRIVDVYKQIGRCYQAMTVLEIPHEVQDNPQAQALSISEGKIEFQNVSFSYKQSSRLFSDLNVSFIGGSKVGLVGYSGCGKTTFIHLLLRLYDVSSGAITIDGQNIKDVSQETLRNSISMIPQDITLFHRTLLENIHYGDLSASKEEVLKAAKLADCDVFIDDLPQGYETLVGERGIKLSGGQRQRIAIARGFLKKAPIFILDEATSSLDSVTEKNIWSDLKSLMTNKTVIVIAHRLSTLLEMDRILVFKDGRIVEDGCHQTLLAKAGHYAKMWSMQSNGFLPQEDLES